MKTGSEIEDANVIEAIDGHAVLSLFGRATMTFNVSGEDSDSMYRDEDGSVRSVWTVSGEVERDVELEVTVELDYDLDNRKDITVTKISFDRDEISISVDEGELSVDYDYDDEGFI